MIILGVDPGIGRMGWGLIEEHGSKIKALDYGCLETSSKEETPQRLLQIRKKIVQLIDEFRPELLAIEDLFFNNNAKTAFVVGQARGVVIATAAEKNLDTLIYTPLQVKIALTGYGRAEKNQVGHMVKIILGLPEIPKPDDTADALAIALTGSFSRKLNKL